MRRLVETVAESEGATFDRMLMSFLNPAADIIRVRIQGRDVDGGSVGVEDGLRLFKNAERLFAYSALDVFRPRIKYSSGHYPSEIQSVVDRCRFGQTEFGSYVVSLVCPLLEFQNGSVSQITVFDDKEPMRNSLTRKATSKLLRSVSEIKNSACSMGELFAKGDANISVNFLQALADIGIQAEGAETEISVQWAVPSQDSGLDFDTVNVGHDLYAPIIAQIRRLEPELPKDRMFVGRIKLLTAPEDITARRYGYIDIAYIKPGSKLVGVIKKIRLTAGDYETALLAHKEGRDVRVACHEESGSWVCDDFSEIL